MTIPLESRAHVIFTYTLVENEKNNIDIKKLYYEGIRVKVPKRYDLSSVAKLISSSTDSTEIEILGLHKINSFTKDKKKALTFRYDEVYENARQLMLQESANMYFESLDEEGLPF